MNRSARVVSDLGRDLRYGLRQQIVGQPLVSTVVVITLALGIGINAAIFSLLRGVVLRPLPYPDEERVVMVWHEIDRGSTTWIAEPEYLDYRTGMRSLDDVAAFDDRSLNLTGGGEPLRLRGTAVTPNLFEMLGVEAARGRTFEASDAGADADPAVLISDGLFRRRFGSDPGIVGAEIVLDGRVHTIVGVMAPGFDLPLGLRSGTPLDALTVLDIDPANHGPRNDRSIHAVARLADGVSLAAARQEFGALHERLRQAGLFPENLDAPGLVPVRELLFGEVQPLLLVLVAAAALVLLIACTNVANLLLARGEGRRTEIGIRRALGAGGGRLLRQVLAESLTLALLGGAVGLLVGAVVLRAASTWIPAWVPRVSEITVDATLLWTTLAVSLLTGIVFGTLPALRAARTDVTALLQGGDRGASPGRRALQLRRALVVGQLMLAVVLTVGALLLIRSFTELRSIDPGFEPENVLTLRLELPATDYSDADARLRFWERVVADIEELPGVVVAGGARIVPLTRTIGSWSITIEGREPQPGVWPEGDFQVVWPGYFEAMSMRRVEGRFLERSDTADSIPVTVINRTMAATYWPGDSPIGKRFRLGDETTPWYEIVGVVEDVRHDTVTEEPRTEMYQTVAQFGLASGVLGRLSLVVRTDREPLGLVGAVRQAVWRLDPNLPIADVRTMQEIVASATADTRFASSLLMAFSALALLLSSVGIYGVISYSVHSRRREIGLRMAIGADRRAVVREVMSEGMALLATGLALGMAASIVASRLLSNLLYRVEASDPLSFAVVGVSVACVALGASWLPARRAASVDPSIALREG